MSYAEEFIRVPGYLEHIEHLCDQCIAAPGMQEKAAVAYAIFESIQRSLDASQPKAHPMRGPKDGWPHIEWLRKNAQSNAAEHWIQAIVRAFSRAIQSKPPINASWEEKDIERKSSRDFTERQDAMEDKNEILGRRHQVTRAQEIIKTLRRTVITLRKAFPGVNAADPVPYEQREMFNPHLNE